MDYSDFAEIMTFVSLLSSPLKSLGGPFAIPERKMLQSLILKKKFN